MPIDPFTIGVVGGVLYGIAEDIGENARYAEAERKALEKEKKELDEAEKELRQENDRLVNEVLRRKNS